MAIEHNCCPRDEIVSRASITAAGIAKAATIARAPKVTFTADPLGSGKIAYLRLGAKNKKSKAQTKVIIAFRLKNNEPKKVTLTGVTLGKAGKYALEPFVTPARYQQKWNQHTKAGLHVSYLSACGFPGGARFTAISAS